MHGVNLGLGQRRYDSFDFGYRHTLVVPGQGRHQDGPLPVRRQLIHDQDL